ncbi:PREDICTED: microfibrillar-associated protein 5 [Elephantulus edwardii]|uniref:microfibrillar-associated protein 5 n=1 Tax=Elephantulus edwardii TaxID=28737 RepID=UPI0003F0627B|nr:PREDICTED: microfibrillar-associated protein 5 [Elephantulus edwardii]
MHCPGHQRSQDVVAKGNRMVDEAAKSAAERIPTLATNICELWWLPTSDISFQYSEEDEQELSRLGLTNKNSEGAIIDQENKKVLPQKEDDVTSVTPETFTDDINLVNDPATDETVLADIEPSTDDLALPNDRNTTTECRDEKFPCTRLYSVHRPVKQCINQLCLTSLRRMYIINNEICSRLVCKEHEAMKDELCRQMAGLPPRRLRRSNYFRLPPCEDLDLQRTNGP